MIVCLLRTWGVWFLAVQLVRAEVTLENGAYSNLVVSFSSNLRKDEGRNIVEHTKDLLKKTSAFLNQSIGIPIGQVTFVLPEAWDVSGYDPAVETIPPVEPDIVVDHREGSPFGKGPHAEQYGGCGVRGTHIDLPYSFYTLKSEEAYPKEKRLAREWLKFRYGVFDEHGFSGDTMYPDHYRVPGDEENVRITECTDPAMEYSIVNSNNETCSLDQRDTCGIRLGDGASEVKSSLMYLHEELINVEHVCGGDHAHNFMSPSKHNLLCSEKSVWDVLKESNDFKDKKTQDKRQGDNTDPVFQYVKFSKPNMYIVFETTNNLQPKKEDIIFALRRIAFDLPEGTPFGLKSFIHDNTTENIRPLSELGEDRSLTIEPSFEAPSSESVCPLCALKEAIKEIPQKEPGVVILITASNSTEDNSQLLKSLKNSRLFLLLITIENPETPIVGYNDLMEELMHLNQGHLVNVASFESDIFETLYKNILSHSPTSPPSLRKEIVHGTISENGYFKIPEDTSTEQITIWMNRKLNKNQLQCTYEAEAGEKVELLESTSVTYVTYISKGSVNCKLGYGEPVLVQATKPHSETENHVSVHAWVHDTTRMVGTEQQQADPKVQMPVIIYAKISYRSYPVHGAKVEAVVKDSDGTEGKVDLVDDGRGDPDITMNDGIYSGYFLEFSKEGSYNVKVEIKADETQAKALKIGNDRCCGSKVEVSGSDQSTIQVPTFNEFASTLFNALSSKPDEGYPPFKILDLRVSNFEPPSLLELSWTAPGGEKDQGNATHYEIKVFCDSSNHCQENGFFPAWITPTTSLPTPGDSGHTQTVQLSLSGHPPVNTTLRITIEAVRGAKSSGPSNSVRIWLTGRTDEDPTTTVKTIVDRKSDAVKVGNIIGWTVVGILVFFCIGGLVYFLVTKNWRERKDQEAPKSDELDSCTKRSNSFRISEGKRAISFPVLLYTHDQVKDVREKTKVKHPPLYRAGVDPKPWVSLGELAEGSDGSGSTARVDEGSTGEMKQLDASSLDLELNGEWKEVKF